MTQNDTDPEVIEQPEEIREAIESLEGGDEITWTDVNGRKDNQKVWLKYEGRGVSLGDPVGPKSMYLDNKGFITSMGDGDSLPTYGMDVVELIVWEDVESEEES